MLQSEGTQATPALLLAGEGAGGEGQASASINRLLFVVGHQALRD